MLPFSISSSSQHFANLMSSFGKYPFCTVFDITFSWKEVNLCFFHIFNFLIHLTFKNLSFSLDSLTLTLGLLNCFLLLYLLVLKFGRSLFTFFRFLNITTNLPQNSDFGSILLHEALVAHARLLRLLFQSCWIKELRSSNSV